MDTEAAFHDASLSRDPDQSPPARFVAIHRLSQPSGLIEQLEEPRRYVIHGSCSSRSPPRPGLRVLRGRLRGWATRRRSPGGVVWSCEWDDEFAGDEPDRDVAPLRSGPEDSR